MANPATLRTWGVDEVSRWLCSVSLTHLVYKFEANGITGEQLYRMDEGAIPLSLKLSPAEKTTLSACVRILKESANYKNSKGAEPHRPRTHSDEKKKKKSSTASSMPARITTDHDPSLLRRDSALAPEYKLGSAGDVLDDKCRHSGWIKKRGGGYKSWRRRYLVLRLGFAYYYENENSAKPKGHFCLHDCRVSRCTEDDKIKGFKWVFKVVPVDPTLRTFYVATAAKHEMEKWIKVLNEEIARFDTNSFVDGEEEDYEHIYDPVYEEDEEGEEDDGGHYEDPVYEGVKDEDDDDDDDPYTRVRDEIASFSLPSPRMSDPRVSPTHRAQTMAWQITDPTKSRKGKGNAPVIPPRSARSLMETPHKPEVSPVPPPRRIEDENPYLKIVGDSEPIPVSPTLPHVPQSSHLSQSPHVSRSSFDMSHRMSSPTADIPSPHVPRSNDDPAIEEEDPYYIRLQTLDEVIPAHCIFDNIPREEAESRLARTGRIGTYLLRDGTHKGAKHVLSVLTGMDSTKHYKLYQKEDSQAYCLTEGKLFPSLPQLIEYYQQEDLPKTPSVRLSEPYHPLDH